MTREEKIQYLQSVKLPIKYEDGRQLQFYKNGIFIDAFDPVYEINCDEENIKITGSGYRIYELDYDCFDYIVDLH